MTNLRPIKLTFIQHQISFGLPDSTSTDLRFLSINHPFFRLFYDGTRRPERRRVDLLRFKCFEVYLPKNSQFWGKTCSVQSEISTSSVVSHPCLKRAFRVSFRTRERVQDRILWRFVWALCHVSISPDKVKGMTRRC